MIWSSAGRLMAVSAMVLGSIGTTWAQTPQPPPPPPPAPAPAPIAPAAPEAEKLTEQKDGAKPKTLWDEFKLFSYVEMGATFNLNGGSKGVPGSTSDGWTTRRASTTSIRATRSTWRSSASSAIPTRPSRSGWDW